MSWGMRIFNVLSVCAVKIFCNLAYKKMEELNQKKRVKHEKSYKTRFRMLNFGMYRFKYLI